MADSVEGGENVRLMAKKLNTFYVLETKLFCQICWLVALSKGYYPLFMNNV